MHVDTSVEFSYCPTEGCGKTLTEGPNGEEFWCDECCLAIDSEAIRIGSLWRKMSLADRQAEIEKYGAATVDRYGITEIQYREALDTIAARKGAKTLYVSDVSPTKATLPSLARSISDVGALRELIDNAIDSAQRKELRTAVTVSVEFNVADGTVVVRDNAGGMGEEDLLRCLILGSVKREADAANVIGRFGVGAKEAIYHFGREVIIRTREHGASRGLRVEVPEAWLDRHDWNVEVQSVEDVRPGSTEIRIGSLQKFDFPSDQIRTELWTTYRKRIEGGTLSVVIAERELSGAADPERLYLPELYPRKYIFQVYGVLVELSVCVLRDAPDASGIFFYAFGRQYAHWFWNDPKAKMIFDKPPQHKLNTHFRVDIDFSGRIDDLPINANKDEVETNRVFAAMAKVVEKACRPYLDSVSWLSQGDKSYVDRFAGPEHAHTQAIIDERIVDLGKIYDGWSMPKQFRADVDNFKKTLDAEINMGKSEPVVDVRVPATPPVSGPGTLSPLGGNGAELFEPDRPAPSPSVGGVVTLKVLASSVEASLMRKLREQLRKLGDKLGISVEIV